MLVITNIGCPLRRSTTPEARGPEATKVGSVSDSQDLPLSVSAPVERATPTLASPTLQGRSQTWNRVSSGRRIAVSGPPYTAPVSMPMLKGRFQRTWKSSEGV